MKCKHHGARRLWRWVPTQAGSLTTGVQAATNICALCGHWLPLGPAAADTPEVAIEKRAAELAAMSTTALAQAFKRPCNWDHLFGWRMYGDDDFEPNDSELSGYLARAIYEHANAIAAHDQTHGGG